MLLGRFQDFDFFENIYIFENLLRVPIYVTKCRSFNENHVNHKICQIVVRQPGKDAPRCPQLL